MLLGVASSKSSNSYVQGLKIGTTVPGPFGNVDLHVHFPSPVRRVFFIDMGSRGHTWSTQGPSCSLHFLESQVCINPAVPEAGGDSSFNPGDACPKVGSAETQDVDFRTLGTILSQPLTNPCLSCRRSSPRFPNRSQRLVPCIQNSVYLFLNSFFFSSLFRSSCFCKVAGRTSTHMILSEDKMDAHASTRFHVLVKSPLQNRPYKHETKPFGKSIQDIYLNWDQSGRRSNFSRITSPKESATTVN